MDPLHVIKYNAPTKFDCHVISTTWEFKDDNTHRFYVQTSPDASDPHWESLGLFLEKSFGDLALNQTFIQECMRLYQFNQHKSLQKIAKIIEEHKK